MSQRSKVVWFVVLGVFAASVSGCCRKCPETEDPPSQATEIPLNDDQTADLNSEKVQRRIDSLSKLSLSELSRQTDPVITLTEDQEKAVRRDFAEYFSRCKFDRFSNLHGEVSKLVNAQQPTCDPPLPPLDVRLTKGNTTYVSKRDASTSSICAFYQVYTAPIFSVTPNGELVQIIQFTDMLQIVVEENCYDNMLTIGSTRIQCCERQRTEDVVLLNLVNLGGFQTLKIQVACCTAMYTV